MSFEELLLMLLTDEIARRDNTAADNRAAQAGLDPTMRLEQWDKTAKVSFDKRVLSELVSLRFLETHRHVCVLGPVGVGKTFVANALGHLACRHGYNVTFARADETLRRLRQSRFDNSRDAEMVALTTLGRINLVQFVYQQDWAVEDWCPMSAPPMVIVGPCGVVPEPQPTVLGPLLSITTGFAAHTGIDLVNLSRCLLQSGCLQR
jgi:hypothetical protein